MKEESYNEYYSLRCAVQETISKSESAIEQKITTIACGLLGVSVAIFPFQAGHNGIPFSLMFGWIFLCLGIIGNLVSILVAKKQATKIMDDIDNLLQADIEYEHKTMYNLVCHRNKYTDSWNIISVILLSLGIVCTLLSVLLN